MPTAHKVLVKAGESALSRTSAAATATSSSAADAWEVFQFQVSEEHRLNDKVDDTVNEWNRAVSIPLVSCIKRVQRE